MSTAIVLLVLGLPALAFALHALKTGEFPDRAGRHLRDAHPVSFWGRTLLSAAVGIAMVVAAIFVLFGPGERAPRVVSQRASSGSD